MSKNKRKGKKLKIHKPVSKAPEILKVGKGFLVSDEFGEKFAISKREVEKTKAFLKKRAEQRLADPNSPTKHQFDLMTKLIGDVRTNAFQRGEKSEKRKYQRKEYEFIRVGDYWNFSFQGKSSKSIRHLKGFTLIEYLLRHPKQKISAEFLQSLESLAPIVSKKSRSEAEGEGLVVGGLNQDFQPLLDSKTISEIRENIEALEANSSRTFEEVERLDFLRKYYKAAFNPQIKRLKGFETPKEKIRKSVAKSINDAIKKISSILPGLSTFLKKELKLGNQINYRETKKVNWHFSLSLPE